jgi:hypothetical protein
MICHYTYGTSGEYDCIKKIISASRALSELKGAITTLKSTFIDTINLQEAKPVLQ